MLKSLCLQDNLWGYMLRNCKHVFESFSLCCESEEKTDCKFDQNLIKREEKFEEHSLSTYVTILIYLHTCHLPPIKEHSLPQVN